MDESLSWRAKLARANINILGIHPDYWLIEFTYHPKPGIFKWCKTAFPSNHSAEDLLNDVLKLRKELEG